MPAGATRLVVAAAAVASASTTVSATATIATTATAAVTTAGGLGLGLVGDALGFGESGAAAQANLATVVTTDALDDDFVADLADVLDLFDAEVG